MSHNFNTLRMMKITIMCIAALGANAAAPTMNIVQLAQATPDLSTLVTAVVAGNLTGPLSGPGPFTVFAPTNEAFAKVPADVLKKLLEPKNIKELDAVLEYHVLAGAAVHAKDLKPEQKVKTLEGDSLFIEASSKGVEINHIAHVTIADVDATNGVVHIIDAVLLPKHIREDMKYPLLALLAPSTTARARAFTHYAGALSAGNDVIPPLNMTLVAAEAKCGKNVNCTGFTFKSLKPAPFEMHHVYFKGDSTSLVNADPQWQSYLKAPLPPRRPAFVRHFNLSVVPARCGDIDVEPLMPPFVSDDLVQDYAAISVDYYSDAQLEKGGCGKDYPSGGMASTFTKRANPPSLPAPWFSTGDSSRGASFPILCLAECQCILGNHTPAVHPITNDCRDSLGKSIICPPCKDTLTGRCIFCSPSFNHNLEGSLVSLWCDPSNSDCKNGQPSRPLTPPTPPTPTPAPTP
jgi:uncharacterized surface protein with fasciclin (FAS1) repeats